ncbi:MAG: hypothetical protein Q8O13_11135 [Candidatus Omnitrophota bacterium]|nr:hypothetical protein [Candidatus Omnitrophota bacterium]
MIDKFRSSHLIPKLFYFGLFILSFCLLALEILLTRILSVIFWYHFAFLVVSVALFGMTVGALIVYLAPKIFLPQLTQKHIAVYAYISSFAIIASLLSLFYLPALFAFLNISGSLIPILYILLSLPFIAIGVCLSLSLSRFPEHIGKIYSINLIGSALGCIGIIFILNSFNAPSAILFIACLSALSALLFGFAGQLGRLFKLFCILTMLIFMSLSFKNEHSNSITPLWVKGTIQKTPPFYSKWNFFSYLTVGVPSRKPFGWGFSPKISQAKINTQELMLLIDEGAGTVLTKFNDLSELEYLKLDVSAMAYYLRNNDDVLVLGSGGGRDLLTAVLFGAKKVVGVEINKDINDIAFNKLRDFSGKINNYSQIQLIVDEGRSYVSRSKEKYDIIQASLVDSFAAFANGAFALTENSLYTKEAWVIFLEHLKENGILTFSRWYDKDNPSEIYRLIALAKSALQEIGIKDPRQNIALVRHIWSNSTLGVGTILVSKSSFSDLELVALERISDNLEFELVLSPKSSGDINFISILENTDTSHALRNLSSNISSPTDNKPFFFYFAKFKDIFSKSPTDQGVIILRKLFFTIVIFGIIFIMIPLIYKPHYKGVSQISANMLIYFASIGLAFMLVEIPLMQRLGILLGHPIYGLTVVLFSLLFSCGIGSYLTKYLNNKLKTILPFVILVLIIFIFVNLLPLIINIITPSLIPIKILVSLAVLVLIGLFMGMLFPIGMKTAGDENSPRVLYWGINGFASVCGSALAAVILINFGFQKALIVGAICYLIAFLSLLPNLIASKD